MDTKNSNPQKLQPNRDWNNDLRRVGEHLMAANISLEIIADQIGKKDFLGSEVIGGLVITGTDIAVRDHRTSTLRAFAEYESARDVVANLEMVAKSGHGDDLEGPIAIRRGRMAEALEHLRDAINTAGAVNLWKHQMGENAYLLVEVSDPEISVNPVLSIQGMEIPISYEDKWTIGTLRFPSDGKTEFTHYACDQNPGFRKIQIIAVCGCLKGKEISEKLSLILVMKRGKYDRSGLMMHLVEVANRNNQIVSLQDCEYKLLIGDDYATLPGFLDAHIAPASESVPNPQTTTHLVANTIGEQLKAKGMTPDKFAEVPTVIGSQPEAGTPPAAIEVEGVAEESESASAAAAEEDSGPAVLDAAVERGSKKVKPGRAATGRIPNKARRTASSNSKGRGRDKDNGEQG